MKARFFFALILCTCINFVLFAQNNNFINCDGYKTLIQEINLTDDYKVCFYSEENYPSGRTLHSLIFADERFDYTSNKANQNNGNYKCIYFSICQDCLKVGLNKIVAFDGSFEGYYIENGIKNDIKLNSPLKYYYDGENILISGTARIDKIGLSKNDAELIYFSYSGKIQKRCFVDLWPNPSYQF